MDCETLYVDGEGKVCVKCIPCRAHTMIKAPKRKIMKVKCSSCGTVTQYKLEFRKTPRSRFIEKGMIGLREIKIYNISLGGIRFSANADEYGIGQKVKISFPIEIKRGEVEMAELNAKIVNASNGKYGAEFVDLLDESRLKQAIYRKTHK